MTVATTEPRAKPLRRALARDAEKRTTAPRAMSSVAPAMIIPFSPSHGMSTKPAATTPTIDPRVLTPNTRPMARSPTPPATRMRVINGRVTPAQKVAGSMIASPIP